MSFTEGQQRFEPVFTLVDKDRIWELFFGKRWSLNHIAQEYGVRSEHVIRAIDSESERRWHENHPRETNRERLFSE
jgi:hypothetical protein